MKKWKSAFRANAFDHPMITSQSVSAVAFVSEGISDFLVFETLRLVQSLFLDHPFQLLSIGET